MIYYLLCIISCYYLLSVIYVSSFSIYHVLRVTYYLLCLVYYSFVYLFISLFINIPPMSHPISRPFSRTRGLAGRPAGQPAGCLHRGVHKQACRRVAAGWRPAAGQGLCHPVDGEPPGSYQTCRPGLMKAPPSHLSSHIQPMSGGLFGILGRIIRDIGEDCSGISGLFEDITPRAALGLGPGSIGV